VNAKLLVSIGAEGGFIAVYGDVSDAAHPRYRVVVADQTLTLLNEEEGGTAIRKDSGWLDTWSDAMKALDRYPWPHLACMSVDPTVAAAVWKALEEYVGHVEQPIRESAMQRWREACAIELPGKS
jgi:hypothetical protein